jgi:hypothetical protein
MRDRGPRRLDAPPPLRRPPRLPSRLPPPNRWTLARLPTPEQIAAQVRRQPIGAVIADICRDFGITASHPLWRDVQRAIIKHGGSLARLAIDIINRPWPPIAQPPTTVAPTTLQPNLQFAAPGGTGPP